MNFYEKLNKKFNNSIIAKEEYTNGNEKIKFYCKNCKNYFYSKPRKIIESSYKSCHLCRKREKENAFRDNLIQMISDEIYEIVKIKDPIKNNEKISLKHKECGNIFHITVSNFKSGRKCPYCSNKSMKRDQNFFLEKIDNIDSSFLKNYELKSKYIGVNKNIKIKHKECGKIYNTTPNRIYRGNRCGTCSHKSDKYNFKEVKDIIEKDKKFKLLSNSYTDNKHKLKIKCLNCGNIQEKNLVSFQDGRNRKCVCEKYSLPIQYITNFLINENINFEIEKRFDNCRNIRPLPFDIFINDFNILIEYDGEQHFKPIYGKEKLDKTRINDRIKNNFCNKEGIELIRINCYDDYKDKIENLVQRLSKVEHTS